MPLRNAALCNWAPPQNATNVLLVADPQLIDNHTYPGRNELLLKISKHTVDVYLAQNYKAMVNHLQPDYIFFLGDYLDNGRLLENAYYEREVSRFERIFNRWRGKYIRGENWFTDVPGNHDIGFGDGVKIPLTERFARDFGTPNVIHEVAGVEFVLVDTPSYSSKESKINSASRAFVKKLPKRKLPRVLLNHVPLYRDLDTQLCGPLRESSNFAPQKGYQYQLMLTEAVLDELLTKIDPVLVFSGDDHDYCEVMHSETTREITVKSISMAMGIRYPAVQLLSFVGHGSDLDYNTHMCYLPTPYVDVIAYIIVAVVSGFILLWWNVQQRSGRYNYSILPSWDAEDSTAVLMDRSEMSKKVSNFLKEQDEGAAVRSAVPKYTFTTESKTDKALRKLRVWKLRFYKFLRKWNLMSFLKHCSLLGAIVVLIYALSVWSI